MTAPEQVTGARKLAASGDVVGAIECLEAALAAAVAFDDRRLILEALVTVLVVASQHARASHHARELERLHGLPARSRMVSRVLTKLVKLFGFRPRGLFAHVLLFVLGGARAQRGPGTITFGSLRAVQFAYFWDDIADAPRLALLQLAVAQTDAEAARALAWLGYAHAYAGRREGLHLLRRALTLGHRKRAGERDVEFLSETYPLLAIGYMMCDLPVEAERLHLRYLAREPDRTPFYKLLCRTNLLGCAIARGAFAELRTRIDECLTQAFALSASRHHLQVHGSYAVLLAAEARTSSAGDALAIAFAAAAANDNALDWTIFHSLAGLTHLLLGSHGIAQEHVAEGRKKCAIYGDPKHFVRRFDDLQGALDNRRSSFELLMLRSARSYAATRIAACDTFDGRIATISRQLGSALATFFAFDLERDVPVDEFLDLLKRTFDTDYAIASASLGELRQQVHAERGIAPLGLGTVNEGELRIRCKDGRLFVGVESVLRGGQRGSRASVQRLAVGLATGELDVATEPLLRAALRLAVAQYASLRTVRASQELRAQTERMTAIARTAQMLAHDVRRPFALLQAGITALSDAQSADDVRAIVATVLPDVERASLSVRGLIEDVMGADNDSPPRCVPVLPEALLLDSFDEIFRLHPECQLVVDYDLRHSGPVFVDGRRVQRVFSNIILNAIQAMSGRGRMWCTTESSGADVLFRIGNEGPTVAPAEISRVFEPFFTKNKANGTGLGLAIAHHVVALHGGKIWCDVPDQGIEFAFTLPGVASSKAEGGVEMLRAVDELRSRLPTRTPPILRRVMPSECTVPRLGERGADGTAVSISPDRRETSRIRVAFVDDSGGILMSWRRALGRDVEVLCFRSPAEFWRAAAATPADGVSLADAFSVVVTDYRFDEGGKDGAAFARELRTRAPNLPIVLCSSGVFTRAELACTVDLVIEKTPMSWPQLEALLARASALPLAARPLRADEKAAASVTASSSSAPKSPQAPQITGGVA